MSTLVRAVTLAIALVLLGVVGVVAVVLGLVFVLPVQIVMALFGRESWHDIGQNLVKLPLRLLMLPWTLVAAYRTHWRRLSGV